MANREIEAILKISSKLGSLQALKTLQRELKKVDSQAKAYNRSQMAIARAGNAAYAASTRFLAPAALGYAAANMVRTGARIEDAMFGIQKKSGATQEQIAKLKSEIMDLGQEVPVSIEEIAAAYERGAAAGIPLDQLRDFAKLTAQVADSWDMLAEDTANAFAGFEAGMGIKRQDMALFADLINYLADSGIADEKGIVEFLDRAGASLKNFGMSARDSAAIGAALLNLKMPAEVAARAVDTLTGKLLASENLSPKAFKAFREIVGDVDKFKAKMSVDAKGALIDFFESLEKMTGQKRTSLLGALMGEGFDDEIARMVGGLGEIKRNIKEAQDENAYAGSIAGLSEQKLDLFSSKLKLLTNSATELRDKLFEKSAKGGGLLDGLNAVVESVNDATDRKDAEDRALENMGVKGFWEKELWRLKNGDRATLEGLQVDGGYRMNKQVLPELKYDGARPVFGPDVPIPMKRPQPPSPFHQGEIRYNNTPVYFPPPAPTGPSDVGMNAFGDFEARLEKSLSTGGDAIKDGGRAVAEGGSEAGRALQEGAAALRGAAAALAGAIGALNSGAARRGVNADIGKQGGDVPAIP